MHPLEKTLNYRFKDAQLLTLALTHRSLGLEGTDSNQRLEFLGDRVLGLVVAHLLFTEYHGEREGELARRHARLVSKDTLAEVAKQIGLGAHLHLSASEDATGGRDNPSHLEDACEALIGAMYLDGGLGPAASFIETYWKPLLLSVKEPPKDAKTELQEWAQGRGMALPEYREVARSGPDHAPEFTIEVLVGKHHASGSANSKRAAEQDAAGTLLLSLRAL